MLGGIREVEWQFGARGVCRNCASACYGLLDDGLLDDGLLDDGLLDDGLRRSVDATHAFFEKMPGSTPADEL